MSKYLIFILLIVVACTDSNKTRYVCPPCDLPCDTRVFDQPGKCPECGMVLMPMTNPVEGEDMIVDEINLNLGSGKFLVSSKSKPSKHIEVFYHKSSSFNDSSKIIMIMPGSGRDAEEYRNAWIASAEKNSLLVFSLLFKEEDFSFSEYHLGGLAMNENFEDLVTFQEGSNVALINDQDLEYEFNEDFNSWTFGDIDHVFSKIKESANLTQETFDLFGHSAGGQFLHRFALFYHESKVRKIVAANSGFYTVPTDASIFPFGMKGINESLLDLNSAFAKELIIMVGALDNENENRGTLLRSRTVDLQGLHRLSRANYFYKQADMKAEKLRLPFNWQLEIIPEVGHDHVLMAEHASIMLYED